MSALTLGAALGTMILAAEPNKTIEAAFDEIVQATVQNAKSDFATTYEAALKDVELQEVDQALVREAERLESPALAGVTEVPAATVVERAAAAIQTGVAGAQVGAVIAPLRFTKIDTGDHDWTLTLAALEGGVTRLGTGYAYAQSKELRTYADVGLGVCPFTAKHEQNLRDKLTQYRPAFKSVCQKLVSKIGEPPPEPAVTHLTWQEAQAACGYRAPANGMPGLRVAADVFRALLKRERARRKADPAALGELEDHAYAVEAELQRLSGFTPPGPDDCISDEALEAKVKEAAWNNPTTTYGAALIGEIFPLVFGFNPGATPESRGFQFRGGTLRADVQRAEKGEAWSLGLGLGTSRESPGGDFDWAVDANLSASRTLAKLGASDTWFDEKGNLVPHVRGGASLEVELPLTKPATQRAPINSMRATLYLEFRFTEALAVRAGIPLEARIVTQAASGTDPEVRDLQFTVPAFATTVLEL